MHLIRTKLHRPKVLGDIVCRSRLHALMDRGLVVPLTLVSASAGYGKSVLVSHWADSLKHPCAWISLDESDSELPQFIDYLAKALDGQLPGAFPATAGLRGAGQLPPVPALAARLINELDRLDAPLVLVLDDYQRLFSTISKAVSLTPKTTCCMRSSPINRLSFDNVSCAHRSWSASVLS